jgi:hypothetical protein
MLALLSSGAVRPTALGSLPAPRAASMPRRGLLAVLVARRATLHEIVDAVVLVRTDGTVLKCAAFVRRKPPYEAESEMTLPPAAAVAHGAAQAPVEALQSPLEAWNYATTGRPAGQLIGGPGCDAVDELMNGVILCAALPTNVPASPAVRARDGSVAYVVAVPPGTVMAPLFAPHLSPDGAHVAMALETRSNEMTPPAPTRGAIEDAGAATVRLHQGCQPVGSSDA